jgi:hypothetical protein
MGKAYSFLDVQATIAGPGGSFNLGNGAGNAEEGIDIEMVEDKNTMTVGADGTPMHSLHAGKAGTVTVRLLKTSPVNAKLQAMYDLQSQSSSLWGQNVISINNTASGDNVGCRSVAFKKSPKNAYAKDGGSNEWVFDAGAIDSILGTY